MRVIRVMRVARVIRDTMRNVLFATLFSLMYA